MEEISGHGAFVANIHNFNDSFTETSAFTPGYGRNCLASTYGIRNT